MSRNRRRYNSTNQVPVRALSPWVVIAMIALVAGMTWVYFKNQQHARGNQIKTLERQLAELNNQNEALSPKIATFSSRATLERRLNEGFIKMVPIMQSGIVSINLSRRPNGSPANEIRAVSNQGINR